MENHKKHIRRPKSWLLRAEIAAIFCLGCYCIVKDVILNSESATAKVTRQVFKTDPNYTDDNIPLKNVVTSILHSQDDPSAIMSDGTIVREADIIDGAKIVKIHKDKVEFEKEGKNWTQKIGERPALHLR